MLEYVEQVRGAGSALDVGSSLAFLDLAQRRGWDIAGVEPGVQAERVRASISGLPPGASLAEVAGQTFDLVTFWEVVEHVKDRPGPPAAARELFEPGGTVLTLVGGNATRSQTVSCARHRRLSTSRAWWYFSPSSYAILLEQAGLEQTIYVSVLAELDTTLNFLRYVDPYDRRSARMFCRRSRSSSWRGRSLSRISVTVRFIRAAQARVVKARRSEM